MSSAGGSSAKAATNAAITSPQVSSLAEEEDIETDDAQSESAAFELGAMAAYFAQQGDTSAGQQMDYCLSSLTDDSAAGGSYKMNVDDI